MDRRNFIAASCIGCMTGGLMLSILEGCSTSKIISGSIIGSDLIVLLPDFRMGKSDKNKFKEYVVVQNERLQYPICVYRFDENNYQALWMKCTHQGTELQVFGDKLQCPAHGSAFNDHGKVENGPANAPLRTFPVTIHNNELKISLK